jgi:UDP-glucose 4-epimerase
MKVLVTGGAGYIGSVCVEELIAAGHEIAVFDNLSEGHRSAVHRKAAFTEGCLSDRDLIARVVRDFGPEAVVHFAASALVSESMTRPSKYFGNNVANGLNLLDAAVAGGVRKIIFSSTAATYGIPDTVPITEDAPTRPVNPYGESKQMFERMLAWYRDIHGLEHVVFRYFNAAGAGEAFGEHHRVETHLIPNVLRVALGQSDGCQIFGTDYPTPDGTCVRDYVHVKDIAQAHILALAAGRQGTFNLGNGAGCSVRQVIETCRHVTGHPIPATEHPRRPGDPPRLVASAAKATRELGWKPRFASLEAIIESAWRWHKSHPEGYPD